MTDRDACVPSARPVLRRPPRRPTAIAVALVLLLVATAGTAAAQRVPTPADDSAAARVRARLRVPDSATVQILTLRDGSTLVGRVAALAGDSVRFVTANGESSVAVARIRDVREAPASAVRPDGSVWFVNPNATRLLFAPTGRMIPRGGGYFSDYLVVFPGFAYGATDHFTVGGGMSLIPGASSQLFYVTPKFGIHRSERLNVAAGALLIAIPDFDDGPDDGTTAGIAYGVGTYGTPDASVTFGVGYGFEGGRLADRPVAMIGGELRVSRRVGLVTENYIVPSYDDGPIVSYAVRFMGEQAALDLGFVNQAGDPIFPGIPFVGFVFNLR